MQELGYGWCPPPAGTMPPVQGAAVIGGQAPGTSLQGWQAWDCSEMHQQLSVRTQMAPISPGHPSQRGC